MRRRAAIERSGQPPQNRRERCQRDDRAQQSESQVQRAVDEKLQVVCDALIGIVEMVTAKLEMEIGAIAEPFGEKMLGKPTPPANL